MNIYKDGLMGLIVGDALGGPVQFWIREDVKAHPVMEMEPFRYKGGYPAGTWSDDGSMALATYDYLRTLMNYGSSRIDFQKLADYFIKWYDDGEYTPFGFAFDEGGTTCEALETYKVSKDVTTCGQTDDWSNGNGSIMRILPLCLFCYEKEKEGVYTEKKALEIVERGSAVTHAHTRSKIGCGLYYKVVKSILDNKNSNSLFVCIKGGLDEGIDYYDTKPEYKKDLYKYRRLLELKEFRDLPEKEIGTGGYVVETLEASIWALITTNSYKDALLKVVNLADDADTTGAVTGGLAGLFYGYDSIPDEWISKVQRRDWIEKLIEEGNTMSTRQDRIEIFNDTLAFIKEKPVLLLAVEESRKRSFVFYEDDYPEYDSSDVKETSLNVTKNRSFEAAMMLRNKYTDKRIAVMNFANSIKAGGGVESGSRAQEESLCRCSTLYPVIYNENLWKRFYKRHLDMKNPLATDSLIYSEDIVIRKTDEDFPGRMNKKDWVSVDIITVAAPNLRFMSNPYTPKEGEHVSVSDKELYDIHVSRAKRILTIAAHKKAEILVLGAFGCGAFCNNPKVVAKAYKDVLMIFPKVFSEIEFAVFCPHKDESNYVAFSNGLRGVYDYE